MRTITREDDMGQFCICGSCVATAQYLAKDFVRHGMNIPSDGKIAKMTKRVLGGLALAALFELVGLGAA